MSGLSRRQFAAEIGMSVGYVKKLVDTGRCILTADGKIDGPASRARIAKRRAAARTLPNASPRNASQPPRRTTVRAGNRRRPHRRQQPRQGQRRC